MSVSGELLQLLHSWLPGQRWFPAKGRGVSISELSTVQVFDERGRGGTATGRNHILLLDSGDRMDVIQVPLTFRTSPLDAPDSAHLGEVDDLTLGRCHVYDGVHDPQFVRSLATLITGRAPHIGRGLTGRTVAGVPQPTITDAPTAAFSGEQSNSSIVIADRSAPAILKLFRVLSAGANPDVEVTAALSAAGCTAVPRTMGWLEGRWFDPVSHEEVSGHLAVLSEYVADSTDAWTAAVDAARDDVDFSDSADQLGLAVARIHRSLSDVFGAHRPTPAQSVGIVEGLAERVRWAMSEARDVLSPYREQLADHIDRLRRIGDIGPVQRIHGDLHLGQVLHSAERGWVVLDFEGEPLRPLSERSEPDSPLRDVVGVLRSFDYAANVVALEDPTHEALSARTSAWAQRAAEAFLAGYARETRRPTIGTDPLLRVYWLDKALYEVVYELRNRPSWLQVPLRPLGAILSNESDVTGSPAAEPTATGSPAAESNPAGRPADAADQPTATVGPAEPTGPAAEPADATAPTASESGPADGTAAPPAPRPVADDILRQVSDGTYHDPHSVLGAHQDADGTVTIRACQHLAKTVAARTPTEEIPLTHEYGGIFTAAFRPADGRIPEYRLATSYTGDDLHLRDDPYRFLPTLGDMDLHLIGEGRHEELWTVLGAHPRSHSGADGDITGTSFAVWAPNAQAVRVIGDFNGWNGAGHAMRSLGSTGVWELFIPGVGAGSVYKFEILGRHGQWLQKADPMAFGTEVPPATGSVVTESRYTFHDDEWIARRSETDPHDAPVSVYEVHLGSWRLGLGYRELAAELVDYVVDLGFTHVEFMPVAEHPFGGSWGYQVTSYYAPTSRFGHPDEFRFLVDSLHQAGIGVILDWVPAHFPKDEFALARFDGEALYEHPDPQRGEHPDWGTLIFDYGRREVRNFLVANALYWFDQFHIDGLRVDAVASMLYLDYSRDDGQWSPNREGGRENLEAIDFLQEVNATAYRRFPGILMIAEESTAFPGVTAPTSGGGLGFGLKWNMGWMHDSLGYISTDPLFRQYQHSQLTFSIVYAFSENYLLPISHDEVVHGKGSLLRKMPGDRWQQLANVRAFLAYQWAHPGKQLIFMGTEFGQEAEWSHDHGLDWWLTDDPRHSGVQRLVRTLNDVYRDTPALHSRDNEPGGFHWLDGADASRNVVSFVRWDRGGRPLVCVANFAGTTHEGYRLALPSAGTWLERVNTDAEAYGGSGVGNLGKVAAVDGHHLGQPAHADLRLPPLSVLYLTPEE
ncbi:1,4-alpha-glucan branching enzyme [Brevibacterium sanguinis]|uniref:1,4-alpha-glucan branching enzyme GlgB n=2 Tax=Brevibacterium TaxID=1696 RepID=A0A366IPV5_9MICO|nr:MULTISPECIES: 1,4-alpha-glucan branching protein GlgB [Brevibacterium]RBP67128.1 1,4-alpha-glucan branching enzyme [Brevibacterium sanguinis]RBP73653.1 1,4-alpha-glucan branching enzyme [Brevibacterium celere]